jgi:hypothetical protein
MRGSIPVRSEQHGPRRWIQIITKMKCLTSRDALHIISFYPRSEKNSEVFLTKKSASGSRRVLVQGRDFAAADREELFLLNQGNKP